MLPLSTILNNAAEKTGFIRSRYEDKKLPSSVSDVSVLLAFPDFRSIFLLSSILLRRYREEMKGSKYFVLCSWPEYSYLFPFVDEYWSIKPEQYSKSFWKSTGFGFNNSNIPLYSRGLNNFFEDVNNTDVFDKYYSNGLTKEFFDRFNNCKVYLPMVPSQVIVGAEFNRIMAKRDEPKVFIWPLVYKRNWRWSKIEYQTISREFWKELCHRLISEGICPVIYKNDLSYDLSPDLLDKAIYVNNCPVEHLMVIMRMCGLTLDVFSGVSRLSIAARCPFICLDERNRYFGQKEYEIDDLCGFNINRRYFYTFSTLVDLQNRSGWNSILFDGIMVHIRDMLKNNSDLPLPEEFHKIVSYGNVRKISNRILGTRFIKKSIEEGMEV